MIDPSFGIIYFGWSIGRGHTLKHNLYPFPSWIVWNLWIDSIFLLSLMKLWGSSPHLMILGWTGGEIDNAVSK
jgi:hypothetical protein